MIANQLTIYINDRAISCAVSWLRQGAGVGICDKRFHLTESEILDRFGRIPNGAVIIPMEHWKWLESKIDQSLDVKTSYYLHFYA